MDAAANAEGGTRGPQILDVFFGLDHSLPAAAEALCAGATNQDGIPVTFSRRIAGAPSAAAFRVTTSSGATHVPLCASVAPGNDTLERFTVLLIGDLGTDPADPPVKLDIVGSLAFDDGSDGQGLSSTKVTPLTAGPEVLLALAHAPADLVGSMGTRCPASTTQIVLTVWEGGVTDSVGGGLGDAARAKFHVAFASSDGGTYEKSPIALAGTGDHDNYVELCLDDVATPLSVRVEAGVAFDPRHDPNPETSAPVTPTGSRIVYAH